MSRRSTKLTLLDKAAVMMFFKRGLASVRLNRVIETLARDIEQDSLEAISKDPPKLIGHYLYLFPHKSSTRSNLLKNAIEVVYAVRRVRGLVRWISAGLLVRVDSKFADAYLITRFELMLLIMKRIRPVYKIIATHMALVSEDDPQVQEAARVDPKNYIDKQTVITWPPVYPLQLIPDFSSKSAIGFVRRNRSVQQSTFVEDLITWNSYYFTRLILEFQLMDAAAPYLSLVSPSLLSELSELTAIKVNRYLEGNLTFDQVEALGNSTEQMASLLNVEIWHQRFLVANTQLQIIDCTTDPKLDFVAGQWQFIFRSSRSNEQCLMKNPSRDYVDLESGIFLSGRVDENWYHFLLDTLPRLLFFEYTPPNVPLVVRHDLPEAAKQIIARLSKREVIEMNGDHTYRVKKLFFMPARSTVFDSKPIDHLAVIQYSPQTITRLRSLIWDVYNEPRPQSESTGAIAILRSSTYRNVTNIQKVREVSATAGFKVFEPSESFYRDQIHLFANASHILAPGGAVLANMIFMQPNTTVIALRSWRTSKLPLWRDLARACNLQYKEVVGTPTYFGTKKMLRQHSDYSISARKLLRKLS